VHDLQLRFGGVQSWGVVGRGLRRARGEAHAAGQTEDGAVEVEGAEDGEGYGGLRGGGEE
jgi:hypothetical protein